MRFVPEAEVIEQLGLPPNVLPSLRRAGKGPKFYRIGSRAYYEMEAVEAWLTTCVQNPAANTEEVGDIGQTEEGGEDE